jgi:ferredoxin
VNGPKHGEQVRAVVDHDRVAMCLQHAPGAFALDDDGQSVFEPTGQWAARDLEAAAEGCPMEAISLLGTGDA